MSVSKVCNIYDFDYVFLSYNDYVREMLLLSVLKYSLSNTKLNLQIYFPIAVFSVIPNMDIGDVPRLIWIFGG